MGHNSYAVVVGIVTSLTAATGFLIHNTMTRTERAAGIATARAFEMDASSCDIWADVACKVKTNLKN